MNQNDLDAERPSIIQEIVFYDKPNIKTIVPEEILPESAAIALGKGDIVFSRIRNSSFPLATFQKNHDDENDSPEASNHELGTSRIKIVKVTSVFDDSLSLEQDKIEKHLLEASKGEIKVEEQFHSGVGSLNQFIGYESLEDNLLESVDVVERSFESDNFVETEVEQTVAIGEDNRQYDKNIEPPRKAYKSVKETKESNKSSKNSTEGKEVASENLQSDQIILKPEKKSEKVTLQKKPTKATKEATSATTKESPFKTPKRPAKRANKKTQKMTMLNYVNKKPKDKDEKQSHSEQKITGTKESNNKSKKAILATEETAVDESKNERNPKRSGRKNYKQAEPPEKADNSKESSMDSSTEMKKLNSIPKKNTGAKRPRGRPRKTSEGWRQKIKSESYYSDEEVSFKTPEKNKNYVELTNVHLNTTGGSNEIEVVNNDVLDELLDETEEQVKTLDRVEEELQSMFKKGQGEERKQTTKGKRKTPGRKSKTPAMLIKKVKSEEADESSEDLLDVSATDEYDTDGDSSRGEWLPLEYAEYRQQHNMRHQSKTYPCKFCGDQFPSYYSMRKHRALEHDDLGTDRKEGTYKESVKCKQEKEQADSDEESREEWMPQDYADYKMKHKMNKMKRVQWYKCKICCAVFSNYYKLSKHRIEHENKSDPYECKQCEASFKDVEGLMAHIRVHQGKDPYQCKKCEKGFMTKEELVEHIPVHILKKGPAPLKRFRCDICSKEFSKLCDIERHTRVHTGEKPCECNICHKRFQQSHNLSKHLLTHLHVKPFQCEICNKKFGRVDVLNRHLLTHSMEKPFKCQLCNKGFIRQVQLTNHIEKIHTTSDRGLVVTNGQSNNLLEVPDEAVIENRPVEEVREGQPSGGNVENGDHEELVVG